ncbi:MAG: DUF167 domain-containing protein [archaeon]
MAASNSKGTSWMRLTVYVKPLSKETRLLSEPDGTLIMNVAAPPTKGKANREIVKWIARNLKKPSSHVRIISGLRSSTKIIEISGVDEAELARYLGIKIRS